MISIFLFLLLANSCGTPGVDRPGDHGSTQTGSTGGNPSDKRPALCADIKDEIETKCTATAAKEGDCFFINYENTHYCVSAKKKREFFKDKTCGLIFSKAQCRGTVVGSLTNPKVCREKFNGYCEDAPSYHLYAPRCKAKGSSVIQKKVEEMCVAVPADKCDGDVVTFLFVKSPNIINAKLCKKVNTNGKNWCQIDQTQVNNHAQDLAKEFCDYQISHTDVNKNLQQYFANKDNSGLVRGYSMHSCNEGLKTGNAFYDNFRTATISGLCEADLSGK